MNGEGRMVLASMNQYLLPEPTPAQLDGVRRAIFIQVTLPLNAALCVATHDDASILTYGRNLRSFLGDYGHEPSGAVFREYPAGE
jgi:hypothetical protein